MKKTVTIIIAIACFLASSANAFAPLATRAVGPKKAAPKKAAAAPTPKKPIKLSTPKKPTISIKMPSSSVKSKAPDYVFDDGLTEIERYQRKVLPSFLTGSAKSQADESTIRDDIGGDPETFNPFPSIGLFLALAIITGQAS